MNGTRCGKANRTHRLCGCVLVAVLLLLAPPRQHVHAQASGSYAAALHVLYTGVEVQRAGTEAWIAVRAGAQMPFGAGDQVRTLREGRALLIVAGTQPAGLLLLLPESQAAVLAFEQGEDGLRFAAQVEGRLVGTTADTTAFADFSLETASAQVTVPSAHFAVQALPSLGTILVSAEGRLEADAQGERIALEAGQGVQVHNTVSAVIDVPYPASFARLDGLVNGCPGRVRARGALDLNVRVGPSLAYEAIGVLVNDTSVRLMAVSAFGERYRIQYLSGYGTILASGVITTCRSLPVIPYSQVEAISAITAPSPQELALLRPFYGTPDDDPLFYRGIAPGQ